jgi:hypothetical protein
MAAKKLCIVCKRPIAKRSSTIYFREPNEYTPPLDASWGRVHEAIPARPDGHREGDKLYLAQRPRNREEAQRYVNGTIISASRDGAVLASVNYWDGESYRDTFFCTNECAMKQGYAAAQDGHRWVWKKKGEQ